MEVQPLRLKQTHKNVVCFNVYNINGHSKVALFLYSLLNISTVHP